MSAKLQKMTVGQMGSLMRMTGLPDNPSVDGTYAALLEAFNLGARNVEKKNAPGTAGTVQSAMSKKEQDYDTAKAKLRQEVQEKFGSLSVRIMGLSEMASALYHAIYEEDEVHLDDSKYLSAFEMLPELIEDAWSQLDELWLKVYKYTDSLENEGE